MHPLVTEAMKKAAVAWITVGEQPAYAVWCLWIDDALYVVSGPGEQPAPGLDRTSRATVSARGDHGGRIVSWPAGVTRLDPESDEWGTIVTQLAGKRLNSASADELAARWARECVVSRLVPAGDEPAGTPDGSEAAPPRPTPAARTTRAPFHLHRVRGGDRKAGGRA